MASTAASMGFSAFGAKRAAWGSPTIGHLRNTISFLCIDRARILFQGLGTDALLEFPMPSEKAIPYRLPVPDFREFGYSDDEPPQG